MATSFGALCDDFYINQAIAVKMDLPTERDTLLHMFDRVRADQPTMASVLGGRGYETYMVGKWHLGFEGGTEHDCSNPLRGGPVDRGFDQYFGIPASLDIPPYFYIRDDRCAAAPTDTITENTSEKQIWTDIQGPFWRGGKIAPDLQLDQVLPRLTEETVSYLSRHREKQNDRPFFMYLALTAPHTPWLPPDSLRGASGAGLYGDFVVQVDRAVGTVLDALDRLDLRENTLLVFTSDNGPWFNMPPRMLEGGVKRWHAGSPGLLRGAKGTTYEGGLRVPAVVRWPDQIPGGRISAEPVSIIDFLPTFANAAGGAVPDDRPIDGYNLLPFLRGETDQSPRDRFFYYQSHQLEAVRDRTWKLRIEQNPSGKPELYNLDLDPRERHNRAEEFPDKVSSLKGDMRDLADSVDGTQIGF
jgi:arylsulfatase A-like enzyme